jgi:hypothetical protein
MIFSSPRPPMMAPLAATHSASVEPMPTASGSVPDRQADREDLGKAAEF